MSTNFKFDVGDEAKDMITGFVGVVVYRTQWLNNCNTYGVQPKKLKDGMPQERQHFDEPQLELIKKKVIKSRQDTGGPERAVPRTNI